MTPPLDLQTLPNELFSVICSLLCNSDIKSLRLTSRCLRDKSVLRLRRVFISANPRNIEVLLAVANHEVFRYCIEEIIWDDAVLKRIPSDWSDVDCGYSEDEGDSHDHAGDEDRELIPGDFVRICKESIFHTKSHIEWDDRPGSNEMLQSRLDKLMPTRDSLVYYNRLLQQQEEVLESGADEKAFRYAVQRFPRLNKVTVTPATHGFVFMPLYETPMIRAFPPGFVYPLSRGWPTTEDLGFEPVGEFPQGWGDEEERKQWRGFCIVTRVLADYAGTLHQVSKLDVNSNKLPTGIDYTLFKEPNAEYDNLCKIVEQPGFNSITLSLITGYISSFDAEDWNFYRNGMISGLLARASNLEELVFQTDYSETSNDGAMQDLVSLFDIFPIDKWSTGTLKHFGLSGIQVTQGDLTSFLLQLPSTVQSIELSFLTFLQGQGDYAGLLEDIRDKLGWRQRPPGQRIKVSMSIRENTPQDGRYISLDKVVEDYIYGDGPSPFRFVEKFPKPYIPFGTGIVHDEFDPSFEVPYNGL